MSTPSSRCKPPANKIIETLTFTTGKMEIRGKVVLSQEYFFPVSLYEHVLNSQKYVFLNRQKHVFLTHLSLSARRFFSLSEHSQVSTFFGSGFALLYTFFLNNSWGFILQFDILENVTQV